MARKKEVAFIDVEASDVVEARVSGGNLNIRAEESIESEVVGVLKDNSVIEIEAKGEEWCKIAGGYVMSKFLEFE